MSNADDVSDDLLGTTPTVLGLLIPKPFGDVVTAALVPGGEGGGAVPTPVEVADDGFGGADVPTPAEPADDGLGGAAVPIPVDGWVGAGVEVPVPCASAELASNAVPNALTHNDVRKDCIAESPFITGPIGANAWKRGETCRPVLRGQRVYLLAPVAPPALPPELPPVVPLLEPVAPEVPPPFVEPDELPCAGPESLPPPFVPPIVLPVPRRAFSRAMQASLSDAATFAHALTASLSRFAGTRASPGVVLLGEIGGGGDAFAPLWPDCELGAWANADIAVASAATISACLKSIFIDVSPIRKKRLRGTHPDSANSEGGGTSGEIGMQCRSGATPSVGGSKSCGMPARNHYHESFVS